MSNLVRSRKARLAVLLATTALSAGITAAPASAQPPQEGLVNVAVTGNTIQIPIGVAANICGVGVGILVDQIETGEVDCAAFADPTAISMGNQGGDGGSQQGLINVSVTNNTIQVPVALAANICGVGIGVLAQNVTTDPVTCEARSRPRARG